VIVTSEFVRDRARDALGLDGDRIHIVPHAIDHTVFRPQADEEREPLILYPARAWPHKNHARLFQSFATLRETRPHLRLVLTGGGLDRLDPLPEGVENLGEVPATQLASLYRRAACLVYPSLYEGFGIPPLEAMAAGTPVVAAKTSSLPEALGSHASFVHPDDVDAIASAVGEHFDGDADPSAIEAARTWAAGFTWAASASRTLEVFGEAIEEVGGRQNGGE
jgi:glycosyltransferase involved in cell wall biosynthesis